MNEYRSHAWEPITDLPDDWRRSLERKHTAALVGAWHEQAKSLREKDLYGKFLERLKRQWAIETGAIEGVYSIADGATLTLIEKGLDAALISHGETSDSPDIVIRRIKDNYEAIQGLYQFVSGERPFGTSYIKELHRTLTENQRTYEGRDTLGNVVTRELPRGEWKKLSNSVEHPDGSKFEYCPPEHVDCEMERLVAMHLDHESALVPPDVAAAWLHHRFTLIHPFTDGNGRVARCLATLVLLKGNWLPLVVTRSDRDSYIAALRRADEGDLTRLVDLLGFLQSRDLRTAWGLAERVERADLQVSEILSAVRKKLDDRKSERGEAVKRAVRTADKLHIIARDRVESIAREVDDTIRPEDNSFRASLRDAARGSPTAHYHRLQIVQCAKAMGYFANLPAHQSWVELRIRAIHLTEILFSFHGIGHDSAGVFGCAPMIFTRERNGDEGSMFGAVRALAEAPFEFSYLEAESEVCERFRAWFDPCIARGLDEWRKSI